MPTKLSIKELELLSGIKAHTLRIWEQRYEILKPERTDTNIRWYTNTDLKKILNISLLNTNGYKISRIAKMTDLELIAEAEKFLNAFKTEDTQIESLLLSLMELNEDRFEKTINNSIIHFGFETTIEKIVFPFFKKLGDMWQVGMVNTAQEHYLSNLIRQKIIINIDKITPNVVENPKRVLLFLPNQELHEMGLLYINFLCKSRGYRIVYLGQSVPLEDLIEISSGFNPNFIITVITSAIPDIDLEAYLQLLNSSVKCDNFFVSGRQFFEADSTISLPNEKFRLFKDYSELKTLLKY